MTSLPKNSEIHRKVTGLVVDSKFQFKMLGYFAGLFCLSTLSSYVTTFLFYWNFKSKALKVGIPAEHAFFKFLNNQKEDMDLLFMGLTALNFMLLVVVGLIVSHRIAGPVNKVKNYIQTMDHESEHFKLRSNDFFQDLEPVVNEVKKKIK